MIRLYWFNPQYMTERYQKMYKDSAWVDKIKSELQKSDDSLHKGFHRFVIRAIDASMVDEYHSLTNLEQMALTRIFFEELLNGGEEHVLV